MAYRIGRCLLSLRLLEADLAQAELAEKLGVKRQQVNKWATGKQNMSMNTAKNVSEILKLAGIDDLYEWTLFHNNRK
ncbi:helix-turn-helix transcriptional regulator [Bacillus mycoides]|uniref:helix-turn-helix transcriptional regulator n=1 Tax=Bacillus mycoides TaxID=1405 RepID=UPI0011A95B04|nr:helix-turn-helix transcriptional regulator [Bacillus mycoides]